MGKNNNKSLECKAHLEFAETDDTTGLEVFSNPHRFEGKLSVVSYLIRLSKDSSKSPPFFTLPIQNFKSVIYGAKPPHPGRNCSN